MNPANSITTKHVYDKEKDEYNTLHSKRGIEADYEEIASISIVDLFHKIWRQDDWGLVTIWTEYQNCSVRFVIEHSNIGYGIRTWVNNQPCYELDGRLGATQSISKLLA